MNGWMTEKAGKEGKNEVGIKLITLIFWVLAPRKLIHRCQQFGETQTEL